MNEEIKHGNLLEALFAAQLEMPVIGKNKKGVHGADYADYEKVWEAVKPIAQKHGLVVAHRGSGKEVVTTVYHTDSKESLDSKLEMSQIDAQKRGAEVTYYMRYNLKMLFNLVIADEDKDAYFTPQEFESVETDMKNAIKKLRTATNKAELKRYWDALTPDERGIPEVEAVKDELKRDFE